MCGLNGQDYIDSIDGYFRLSDPHDPEKSLLRTSNGIVITKSMFMIWRKYLLGDGLGVEENNPGGGPKEKGVMYRWAHPACNQLKSNWGFLAVDWTMADDDDGWEEMKERGWPYIHSEDEDSFVEGRELYGASLQENMRKYVLDKLQTLRGGKSLSAN